MTHTSNISTHIVQASMREAQLEVLYRPIGVALDVNGLMPAGVTFNRFTARYAKFADTHGTPGMLLQADAHAAAFIATHSYEGDLAEGATVWVISRIWAQKREFGPVLTQGLHAELLAAKKARDQRTELHKAVARIAKNKPEDSFEAGFKTKVTHVLQDAAALHLAALTLKVEGSDD
jgi:hypothetical protein